MKTQLWKKTIKDDEIKELKYETEKHGYESISYLIKINSEI